MKRIKFWQKTNVLKHVAIIMDGNRRWAKSRKFSSFSGHKRGVSVAESITQAAVDSGVKYLTLFAFSTENWQRSKREVNFLFNLIKKEVFNKIKQLKSAGVRLRVFGRRDNLPKDILSAIKKVEAQTKDCQKLNLGICFNYGARDEIVRAIRKATNRGLSERTISENLDTWPAPAPDLVIRTGGQQRLSNFLLWQVAYSELYFTPVFWPDFNKTEFKKALNFYYLRQRNFGK